VKLNIGCGDHYAEGWINLDLHDSGPRPDVVGSILELPFPDGSVDRVYCGHVLEHVPLEQMAAALAEVRRVLSDDGVLAVVGPDINLTRRHEPTLIDGVTHGGCRWPGDEHRWIASGGITLAYVTAAGFEAHLLPITDMPDEWPVVGRVELWQFAILAKPKECRWLAA